MIILNSLVFGLGIGLIFHGLAKKKWTSRFHQELYWDRKRKFMIILYPILYWKPVRFILLKLQLYSQGRIEEMLEHAGNPKGVKAHHVVLLQVSLAVTTLLIGALFYGVACFKEAIKQFNSSPPQVEVIIFGTSFHNAPIGLWIILMLISFSVPIVILRYLSVKRERIVMEELGLFCEVVFMSLKAKLTLKEAVQEAAKTTRYLKPYLDRCLNQWHTDKITALSDLKKAVTITGFQLVIDMLIHAAQVGHEKIPEFLEENKKLEDEIRNLEISGISKLRPLLVTFQMAIPFGIVLLVLFYPLIVQVENMLNTF